MSLEFLHEAANIVLIEPNGVGKSTIAANIAHRAILEGHNVRFTNAGNILGELASIDSDSRLQRRLRFYARQHLLVIDEVGYLSYSIQRHLRLHPLPPKTGVACCSFVLLRPPVEYTLATCPIFRDDLR